MSGGGLPYFGERSKPIVSKFRFQRVQAYQNEITHIDD